MDAARFEVSLANGETETAESLWGAHHIIARRAAFDTDPLDPRNILPARIYELGSRYFGGRSFVAEIARLGELSPETGA